MSVLLKTIYDIKSLIFISITCFSLLGCGIDSKMILKSPTLSFDGESILFAASCDNDQTNAVFSLDVSSRTLKELFRNERKSVTNPRYIDDRTIIYDSYIPPNSCPDICIWDLETERHRCVTEGGYGGWDFVLAKKKKIVYYSTPCIEGENTRERAIRDRLYQKFDLFSISLDGRNRTRLTTWEDYNVNSLSVSEENDILVFYRSQYELEPSSIWIYDLENEIIYPFSPDLKAYLYRADDPELSNKEEVTELWNPALSPDGNTIAFTWAGHHQGYAGYEVYISDIQEKPAEKITDLRTYIYSLQFSADGKRIVFAERDEKGYRNIWIINSDGGGLRKVLDGSVMCLRE